MAKILCGAFFISLSCLTAQIHPSAIVVYDHPYQQLQFEKLQRGDTAYIDLMIAADPAITPLQALEASKVLEQLFTRLDSQKLARKNPAKQIGAIFETVHEEILKQYHTENQISEIFTTGHYNCVSASAVYSYMLERMGIAHIGVERPSHVYVMAFPQGEEWVLESTSPAEQGYYQVTDKKRKQFLDHLVKQKIITPAQKESPQLDSILDELYPTRAITTMHLASFQYSNMALFQLDREEHWSAYQAALKAYWLMPEPYQKDILVRAAASWLSENQYQDSMYEPSLSFLLHLDTSASMRRTALQAFDQITLFHSEGDLSAEKYRSLYEAFKAAWADFPKEQALVEGSYYYHLSYLALVNNRFRDSWRAIKSALSQMPDDGDVHTLFSSAINSLSAEESWAYADLLDTLKTAQSHFPALLQNQQFVHMKAHTTLALANYHLAEYEYPQATELVQEFEGMVNQLDPILRSVRELATQNYLRLAIYIYPKDKRQSKSYFAKARQYSDEEGRVEAIMQNFNF